MYQVTHLKGDSENLEDFKIIGVYSSIEKAEKVVSSLRNQPGFMDYPDGFYIDPCFLDKTEWEEGFISGFDAITDE